MPDLDVSRLPFAAEIAADSGEAPDGTPPAKADPSHAAPSPSVPDPLAILTGKTPAAAAPATTTPPADFDPEKLAAPDAKSKHRPEWDKLKEWGKTQAAEAAKLRADWEAAKAASVSAEAHKAATERLKQLEEENKTFSERLKVLDLENHPEFQRAYVAPRNQAVESLKAALSDAGIEADLGEVLSLRGKALWAKVDELVEGAPRVLQSQIVDSVRKVQELERAAASAKSESAKFLEEARSRMAAGNRQLFDEVSKRFNFGFAPAAVPSDAAPEAKAEADAYNQALSGVRPRAEAIALGGITMEEGVEVAHKAANFEFLMQHGIPRLAKIYTGQIQGQAAKIAELEKELSGLRKATPKAPSGSGGAAADPDDAILGQPPEVALPQLLRRRG